MHFSGHNDHNETKRLGNCTVALTARQPQAVNAFGCFGFQSTDIHSISRISRISAYPRYRNTIVGSCWPVPTVACLLRFLLPPCQSFLTVLHPKATGQLIDKYWQFGINLGHRCTMHQPWRHWDLHILTRSFRARLWSGECTIQTNPSRSTAKLAWQNRAKRRAERGRKHMQNTLDTHSDSSGHVVFAFESLWLQIVYLPTMHP